LACEAYAKGLAAIEVFGFGKSFERNGGMHAQLAMFDFGWGELILIGIVALVAIGPKELPGALRTLGQWVAKVRRMATEFQNQFHEALREAELAELKKEVDEMASKAQSYAHFDPPQGYRECGKSAARYGGAAIGRAAAFHLRLAHSRREIRGFRFLANVAR
jgi:Tat protein translocase TatB subunit